MKTGNSGNVFLLDAQNNLLAHSTPGVQLTDGWHLYSEDDAGYSTRSGFMTSAVSGKAVLATSYRCPNTRWLVVIEQETSELFSLAFVYMGVIFSVVFLVLLVSFITFRYVSCETRETLRKQNELLVISETDPLTGLLNRRSMLSRMSGLIEDEEREGQTFVLLLFDIDDFKKINDLHGHIFGDVVLREIATRTTACLRVDDLLFRWGGEEFLLIVTNCDLNRGRAVAEKVRRVICDTPMNDGINSIRVTVTIGMSVYSGESIDNLILEADEALYEGKHQGKNRVIVYSSCLDQV